MDSENNNPIQYTQENNYTNNSQRQLNPQTLGNINQPNNAINNTTPNPPKRSGKIGLIIFIALIVIAIIIGSIALINNNLGKDSTTNGNNTSTDNTENYDVTSEKEIVKAVFEGNTTYLLDASGKIYAAGDDISDTFVEVESNADNKIVDIYGHFVIKLDNGEYYTNYKNTESDKTIELSIPYANYKPRIVTLYRIMLDDIAYIADSDYSDDGPMILTKSGELYRFAQESAPSSEGSFKKVMENVKSIKSNGVNTAIIDNDNNAYVCGYNVSEDGPLGKSDESQSSFVYKVETPKKIAENVKKIELSSNTAGLGHLMIFIINENDELYMMGQAVYGSGSIYRSGKLKIDLTKIADGVTNVYPNFLWAMIEKTDGSLVKIEDLKTLEEEIIIDNLKNPKSVRISLTNILILSQDNILYGYGGNHYNEFGLPNSEDYYHSIIKIRENVKRIFTNKGNSETIIVTEDGELYGAGFNTDSCLGIPDAEMSDLNKLNEFTLIEY